MVPAQTRALGPTAKPLDSTYPRFMPSGVAGVTKVVRADLSGGIAVGDYRPHPDHGLGGSLIEPPPGLLTMTIKASDLVPDDPTASAASETLTHSGAVHLAVTPRSFYLRST
jgi:hypothetical protein